VTAIPSDDIVIVHRGDTDNGRNISGRDAWRIVELILEAHTAVRSSPTPTKPLFAVAFASQLPAVAAPTYVTIDAAMIAELSGRYEIAPNVMLRVFEFQGRLFGNFPGQGEAELFALSRSEFTIRVLSGVRFTFERGANGSVTGVIGAIGTQRLRGVRRE
jgi:hypothetical protein